MWWVQDNNPLLTYAYQLSHLRRRTPTSTVYITSDDICPPPRTTSQRRYRSNTDRATPFTYARYMARWISADRYSRRAASYLTKSSNPRGVSWLGVPGDIGRAGWRKEEGEIRREHGWQEDGHGARQHGSGARHAQTHHSIFLHSDRTPLARRTNNPVLHLSWPSTT